MYAWLKKIVCILKNYEDINWKLIVYKLEKNVNFVCETNYCQQILKLHFERTYSYSKIATYRPCINILLNMVGGSAEQGGVLPPYARGSYQDST